LESRPCGFGTLIETCMLLVRDHEQGAMNARGAALRAALGAKTSGQPGSSPFVGRL